MADIIQLLEQEEIARLGKTIPNFSRIRADLPERSRK